jgi:hypothetical protein
MRKRTILTIRFREQLYNVGYIIYMEFGFVDMLNRIVKIIRKNLIDIRFISIAVLVFLFSSILVFKPGALKEGMGLGYIEGEAPINEPVVETPVVETPVVDTPVVETPVVDSVSVPVPNIDEPCSLCGVECPNNDNACLSSKPSCVMCQEQVIKSLNKKNINPPIVVNVYTGDSGDDGVIGAIPSKQAIKASTRGTLTGDTEFDANAPAQTTGPFLQDYSNVDVDTEPTEGQLVPSTSFPLVSNVQEEIDQMNNL